ncbi:MBL fold metallo-hydrolase [Aliarcobacter cryaerophilus]|uniref:MBL fold metallo-hydrolase n=1 Tax=Aliarcobacter cryaerophilus TaxID=28198 RepID=UPI000AD76363|nr:MBL fold metallo-hydrolase [Aliarcobacter cryaerophilus]
MFILFFVIFSMVLVLYLLTFLPQFGKNPSKERQKLIEQSSNYKNGSFHNVEPKPIMSEGYSLIKELYKTFVKKTPRQKPKEKLPSIKTDLKTLKDNHLVWFGHSTMFLKLNGKTFLIDPVLSGYASPFSFMTKAFDGSDIYSVEDLPEIDYLLISHDHYDHLDYEAVKKLEPKVKKVITGLGVGEHFEYWGYKKEKLIEKDWYEFVEFEDGIKIHFEPAHHNSGRVYANSKNLWVAFVIQTPTLKIFYSGDGGYDSRFKEIGTRHNDFDWAFMENG